MHTYIQTNVSKFNSSKKFYSISFAEQFLGQRYILKKHPKPPLFTEYEWKQWHSNPWFNYFKSYADLQIANRRIVLIQYRS